MHDQRRPQPRHRRHAVIVAALLTILVGVVACQPREGNGDDRTAESPAREAPSPMPEAEPDDRHPSDEASGKEAGTGGVEGVEGAETVDDFLARVREYAALRNRLASDVGRPDRSASSEELADFRSGLRKAIGEARSDAEPGALLEPAVVSHFRELVRHVLESAAPAGTLRGMAEESPGPGDVALAVNSPYPDGAMLSTVPPSLLEILPRLPEDVQYRFVGCRLILVDAQAHLIVDYADECLW